MKAVLSQLVGKKVVTVVTASPATALGRAKVLSQPLK
jgi:hypothetical protein